MSTTPDLTAERIAEQGRRELHARLRTAFRHQAAARPEPVELSDEELDTLVGAAAGRAGGVLWRRALAQAGAEALGIDLAEAISHPAVQRAHELVGAPPYEDLYHDRTDQAPQPAPETEARDGEKIPPEVPQAGKDGEETPPDGEPPDPDGEELPPPAEQAAEDDEEAQQDEDEAPQGGGAGIIIDAGVPQAIRVAAVHLGGIETLRAGDSDIELRFSDAGLDVLKGSSGAPIGRLEWSEIQNVDFSRSRRGLRAGRRRVQELHVGTGRGRASFELPGLTEEQLKEDLEPIVARARSAR
jgi:hypothetical protein